MRRIVFTRPDGGTSVIEPRRNIKEPEGFTDADIEQRAWDICLPADAINPAFVEESVIPQDRTFRDAWKPEADKIVVDLPKAKEIVKQRPGGNRPEIDAAKTVEELKAALDGIGQVKDAVIAK